MNILNLAFYRFFDWPEFESAREGLKALGARYEVRGKLILTPEGLNGFVAGEEPVLRAYFEEFKTFHPEFPQFEVKESFSDTIPFRRYLVKLKREIIPMGREDVRLETEIQPVMLEVRHAVPLALILNELITNALKYGCPADRPSRIRVGFGTEGELLRLSVADDGDGLPSAFSPAESKSLGMRAIEVLARQLGGSFEIGHPKAGASFAVVFPRSS